MNQLGNFSFVVAILLLLSPSQNSYAQAMLGDWSSGVFPVMASLLIPLLSQFFLLNTFCPLLHAYDIAHKTPFRHRPHFKWNGVMYKLE